MVNSVVRQPKQVSDGYLVIGVDPHKKRHAKHRQEVIGGFCYEISHSLHELAVHLATNVPSRPCERLVKQY
jgi:hypothetical protein